MWRWMGVVAAIILAGMALCDFLSSYYVSVLPPPRPEGVVASQHPPGEDCLVVKTPEVTPAGTIVVCEPALIPASVPSPYDGCDNCSAVARRIAWSFDHQVHQWSGDWYRVHRGEVWIWVANAADGMQIGKDDSVSPFGFGWAPAHQDRNMIWRAYARWKDRVSLHERDIQEVIK